MKVKDILEYFLSQAQWVDRQTTADRILTGDPEKDVEYCLVTWMASLRALRCAVERDCPLLICHEPMFWGNQGDLPTDDGGKEKLQFALDNDLIVLRNHDCWDGWPAVGIPWAWAKFLGFDTATAITGPGRYQHRYDIDPICLDELAARIAGRCRDIGEPMVQVIGDGQTQVSRIGIGTGCGCNIDEYLDMGCDCSVVCDDGSCYWGKIQKAEDLNHPVIRVNHGTSEEPGMVSLTQYINDNLDGLQADYLPHECSFRLVGANTDR